MRKLLPALLVFALAISACQKEISFSSTNPAGSGSGSGTGGGSGSGGSTAGTLLVKSEQKTGSETVTVVYQYDAAKNLTRETTTGTSAGQDISADMQYIRNSSGMLTSLIQKGVLIRSQGVDSVVTRIHYDAASKKYTSAVFDLGVTGFSLTDSSVLVYDASGKVSEKDSYFSTLGLNYLAAKEFYTYDAAGKNITSVRIIALDETGATTSTETINVTYDNKMNPLNRNSADAFVVSRPYNFTANNPLTLAINTNNPQVPNYNYSFNYTYNAAGYPVSGTQTGGPGNTSSSLTFYYQ